MTERKERGVPACCRQRSRGALAAFYLWAAGRKAALVGDVLLVTLADPTGTSGAGQAVASASHPLRLQAVASEGGAGREVRAARVPPLPFENL